MFKRKAKWIYYKDSKGFTQCKCSHCKVSYGRMDTPHCPNCGRKMKGFIIEDVAEIEIDSPDQVIINKLYTVIEEFDARESSGNCLSLHGVGWDELCDKDIYLFEQLKQLIKE